MTFIEEAIERAEHLAQVFVNPITVVGAESALVGQHTDPVGDGVQVRPAGCVPVPMLSRASLIFCMVMVMLPFVVLGSPVGAVSFPPGWREALW